MLVPDCLLSNWPGFLLGAASGLWSGCVQRPRENQKQELISRNDHPVKIMFKNIGSSRQSKNSDSRNILFFLFLNSTLNLHVFLCLTDLDTQQHSHLIINQ